MQLTALRAAADAGAVDSPEMDWSGLPAELLSETNWVALVAAILIALTIRKVRAGERALVIRLGHTVGLRGPGKIVAIPFIERPLPFKLVEPCEVVSPKFVRITGREVPISNPEIASEGRDCFIVEASRTGVVLAHSPLSSD